MRRILFLLGWIFVLASCSKDSQTTYENNLFLDYFPATQGSFIIYDCDSVVYNDFTGQTDTFKFQIKEYYESTYNDNSGRNSIRIERWKKEADSVKWFLKDVWSLTKTNQAIEKVEEDVRYLKLLFPPKNGLTWNTNALNSLDKREVEIQKLHTPYHLGNLKFDSTLTMVNTDPENLVYEFRNTEIFAIHTGMVYKNLVDVRFEVPTKKIKSGSIFTMKATQIFINK